MGTDMQPRIVSVEIVHIQNPFQQSIADWNELLIHSWEILEIVRIRTDSNQLTGHGETLVYYTGGAANQGVADALVGLRPSDALQLEGLGVSLTMALFDTLAQAVEVPLWQLFGRPQVRDAAPLSWWNTKMPPELLAAQARQAVDSGYLSHKIKARPWFDVRQQVEAISDATPDSYRIDIDWNSMLVSAGQALPVLRELQANPKVGLFESPLDRTDTAGQARLRSSISVPLVEHYDPGLAPTWLAQDTLDGFVVSEFHPAHMFRQTDTAASFHKDVFLQLCGTGITTAWVAHMGSIIEAARFPAVTAMNIYQHDLLESPLTVSGGFVHIPKAPGLGITLDDHLIETLRVPHGSLPQPGRKLLTFDLGDGRRRQYTSAAQLWNDCSVNGTVPVQGHGAQLTILRDDGSDDFDQQHARAIKHPIWLT